MCVIQALNASKESFNSTVDGQEEKIRFLEKSIKDDHVSKPEYESLKRELENNYIHFDKFTDLAKELENEKCMHQQTKGKLEEVTQKLHVALEEVTAVNSEKLQDKAILEDRCNALGLELNILQNKYSELQSNFEEKFEACNKQMETIARQHGEIESLQERQKQHKSKLKLKETDEEVHRQQQEYLKQALAGGGRKGKT